MHRSHTYAPRQQTARLLSATALAAALLTAATARAQFELQDSTTTADLRGISAPGNGVAWASGTRGTVVRTEDGGYMWQGCAMPPGAEQLDFRGIQAFDDRTALIMSSGKGSLSRIYKTTDGCQSWKLVFTNPDADGFFDAIFAADRSNILLLGDPVQHRFTLIGSKDGGLHWKKSRTQGLEAEPSLQGAFAASNSSLSAYDPARTIFGSGGAGGAYIYRLFKSTECLLCDKKQIAELSPDKWSKSPILEFPSESSGVFAIAAPAQSKAIIAVGGDYLKPGNSAGTAAVSLNDGQLWKPAKTPPHGYRSSVAYNAPTKTWITVGPNGSDTSTDDGRNWRPLRPMPGDAPGTDANWNALAMPWVVGPHGRIGKLHNDTLKPK